MMSEQGESARVLSLNLLRW